MEDTEIIDMYFARNEQAIQETNIKYGKLCFRVAFHILNNYEDSDECRNDTYFVAWNSIPPKRPNCFSAFLCKIIRNLALKKVEYNSAEKRNINLTVSIHELEEIISDNENKSYDEQEIGKYINLFLRKENRKEGMYLSEGIIFSIQSKT